MARPQRRGLAPRTSTKGSVEILDGGEQSPGGCVVPGLLAFAPPLAERLIKQQQGDAVFAAGITGLFEDAHVAKAGDFIEQEENASAYPAVGFIGSVEQRADDDAAEGGRGLQDFQRHLHEHGELAIGEVAGAETAAGDKIGISRCRQPAGILVGVAIDA